MKRDKVIKVRVSEEEKVRIEGMAEEAGEKVSDYVRERCLAAAVSVVVATRTKSLPAVKPGELTAREKRFREGIVEQLSKVTDNGDWVDAKCVHPAQRCKVDGVALCEACKEANPGSPACVDGETDRGRAERVLAQGE